MDGIWQSAQETPAFQWTLLLENISNSGCRMKPILKPVTPCFHSRLEGSLRIFLMIFSTVMFPQLLPCQGKNTPTDFMSLSFVMSYVTWHWAQTRLRISWEVSFPGSFPISLNACPRVKSLEIRRDISVLLWQSMQATPRERWSAGILA